MRVAVVCVISLLMAGGVLAVDLKNEDSKSYEVKIHDGATTTNSSIESNTTRVGICSECTLEVVGVGSIEASGDQVVLVKDGKLSIQE